MNINIFFFSILKLIGCNYSFYFFFLLLLLFSHAISNGATFNLKTNEQPEFRSQQKEEEEKKLIDQLIRNNFFSPSLLPLFVAFLSFFNKIYVFCNKKITSYKRKKNTYIKFPCFILLLPFICELNLLKKFV